MISSTNQHLSINQLAIMLFVLLVVVHNGGQAKEKPWKQLCENERYDRETQVRYYHNHSKACFVFSTKFGKLKWESAHPHCYKPDLAPKNHFKNPRLIKFEYKTDFKHVLEQLNKKLNAQIGDHRNLTDVWTSATRMRDATHYTWHDGSKVVANDIQLWRSGEPNPKAKCRKSSQVDRCCVSFKLGATFGLEVNNDRHHSCSATKDVVCAFEQGKATKVYGAANRPYHSIAFIQIWLSALWLLTLHNN